MEKIAAMCAEKYGKTTEEIIAAAAMKDYLQRIGQKKAERKIATLYDVQVLRIDKGAAVPVRSKIDGAKYAAFIDEAVASSIKKVEKMDTILADRVVGGLQIVDGKHVVERASVEFMSFVEDAYLCLKSR